MAPEVLSETVYTPACDVYSLAVVIYCLLSGTMPFNKSNPGKILVRFMLFWKLVFTILKKICSSFFFFLWHLKYFFLSLFIINCSLLFNFSSVFYYVILQCGQFTFPAAQWSVVSQSVKDLISIMIQVDPLKRPTADQILEVRIHLLFYFLFYFLFWCSMFIFLFLSDLLVWFYHYLILHYNAPYCTMFYSMKLFHILTWFWFFMFTFLFLLQFSVIYYFESFDIILFILYYDVFCCYFLYFQFNLHLFCILVLLVAFNLIFHVFCSITQ